MEKDFGAYEGKKFHELRAERNPPENGEELQGVESRASMSHRADVFLNEHLLPLFDTACTESECVVAIVSHGMFLSTLWKRFLLRLPPNSITLVPELAAVARNSLEHLGGWSNTGYLELRMTREPAKSLDSETPRNHSPASSVGEADTISSRVETNPVKDMSCSTNDVASESTNAAPTSTLDTGRIERLDQAWTTVIHTINGKDHLKNLKRTGGGVGSSRHDSSQKCIDSFFKRRKLE